jgi:hypothetical protein
VLVTSHPFVGDPSQFRVPAVQLAQAPAEQVCVCAVQADAAPHAPLELHVCTALPEHCVEPGAHTPVHAPETHAEAAHATPASH